MLTTFRENCCEDGVSDILEYGESGTGVQAVKGLARDLWI